MCTSGPAIYFNAPSQINSLRVVPSVNPSRASCGTQVIRVADPSFILMQVIISTTRDMLVYNRTSVNVIQSKLVFMVYFSVYSRGHTLAHAQFTQHVNETCPLVVILIRLNRRLVTFCSVTVIIISIFQSSFPPVRKQSCLHVYLPTAACFFTSYRREETA